jgi:hypothetical protein
MRSRALLILPLLLFSLAACSEETPTSSGGSVVGSWRRLEGGLGENHFDAVWANAPDTVIALGAEYPVYRFDGEAWTRAPMPTGTYTFNSMWVSSPRNLYAVGANGLALHFDGSSWTQLAIPSTDELTDVWGTSTGEVFVSVVELDRGRVFRYAGGTWTALRDTLLAPPLTVWAAGAQDVFAAGSGFVARQAGTGRFWSIISDFGSSEAWFDAWGTSAASVFFVGGGGAVGRYESPVFTAIQGPTTNTLRGVFGYSDSDVWAVGDAGAIVHFDGTSWSLVESGTTSDLRDIWGYDGGAIAVGVNGTVVVYDGSRWEATFDGHSHAYQDMFGFSERDVFAVGRVGQNTGYVRHIDGREWVLEGEELLSVWGFDAKDVYAVGRLGGIFHFDGSAWTPMASGTTAVLNGVCGARADAVSRVYAVGGRGTIRAWDGVAWAPMVPPSQYLLDLRDVWALDPTDAFAVGASGTVLHFTGPLGSLKWEEEETGLSGAGFQAIAGRSGGGVIAVSGDGRVFQNAGNSWAEIPLPDANGAPLVDVSLDGRHGAIVADPHTLFLLEGRATRAPIEIPFLGTITTTCRMDRVTFVAGRQGALFEYHE